MNVLKIGAIAAGAYILYQQLFAKSTAAATTTPGTPATTTTTPATSTTTPAPNPTTRQLLMTKANSPATLSFHQWNWYYNNVRNIVPPAPESVGQGDGSGLISVDEYLAAISKAGLSGLSNWRRA